jgi:hypothetical protein
MRLNATGHYEKTFQGTIKPWGKWLRYKYATGE